MSKTVVATSHPKQDIAAPATHVTVESTEQARLDDLALMSEVIGMGKWAQSAVLASFIALENKPGPSSGNIARSPQWLAQRGIPGLTSAHTVRERVQAWLYVAKREPPEPGSTVVLPGNLTWPTREQIRQALPTPPPPVLLAPVAPPVLDELPTEPEVTGPDDPYETAESFHGETSATVGRIQQVHRIRVELEALADTTDVLAALDGLTFYDLDHAERLKLIPAADACRTAWKALDARLSEILDPPPALPQTVDATLADIGALVDPAPPLMTPTATPKDVVAKFHQEAADQVSDVPTVTKVSVPKTVLEVVQLITHGDDDDTWSAVAVAADLDLKLPVAKQRLAKAVKLGLLIVVNDGTDPYYTLP